MSSWGRPGSASTISLLSVALMASVGVKSSTYILHLNVMQRSSNHISSVKGNGSLMKRCGKDSKMCVCEYNENDARLSLTQIISIFFNILFFWTEWCSSVMAALLSAVQNEVRWNHTFLGMACFCLLTDSCYFWH